MIGAPGFRGRGFPFVRTAGNHSTAAPDSARIPKRIPKSKSLNFPKSQVLAK